MYSNVENDLFTMSEKHQRKQLTRIIADFTTGDATIAHQNVKQMFMPFIVMKQFYCSYNFIKMININ